MTPTSEQLKRMKSILHYGNVKANLFFDLDSPYNTLERWIKELTATVGAVLVFASSPGSKIEIGWTDYQFEMIKRTLKSLEQLQKGVESNDITPTNN